MTKERRQELTNQVTSLNNHAAIYTDLNLDHTTITGFFTTEDEFAKHLLNLERAIGAWEQSN